MAKLLHVYALLMFVSCTFCIGQNKSDLQKNRVTYETNDVITSNAPNTITRNIIQDKKGNIWFAAFDGVFQYDPRRAAGTSFTNITSKVSSDRFFSILEDKKGNMWFGTIGSGVYRYDPGLAIGESFQKFTTDEGLVNNEVVCIYEDKAGNIWFGANGGASLYDPKRTDGKFFRNFMMSGDTIIEEKTGKTFPNLQRPTNEVNSIIEDKTGRLWLATRGNTYIYDGKKFAIVTHDGETFTNVRTIIKDKKDNIWLGGADGLWRYDGSTFTNFTENFVGYIIEDKKGNIWTSSESPNDGGGVQGWALSRYDGKSLSDKKPTVTEIKSENKDNNGMIFGLFEGSNGNIWFGALNGVHRYDGTSITHFKGNENPK